MNSSSPPSKRSKLERIMDRVVLTMFLLLFAFCLTTSVYFSHWTSHEYTRHWYMAPHSATAAYDPSNPGKVGLISFIVSLILYGEAAAA